MRLIKIEQIKETQPIGSNVNMDVTFTRLILFGFIVWQGKRKATTYYKLLTH